jgi:hypothetical protein
MSSGGSEFIFSDCDGKYTEFVWAFQIDIHAEREGRLI